MRALFFLNSFVGGGAEKVCLNLARQLYELDIESDFITISDREPDYDIPGYIHVFSLGVPFITRSSTIGFVLKANAFISGKEYVLITAHLGMAHHFASLTKAKDKVLYVMHGSQHLKDKHDTWYYRIRLQQFFQRKNVVTVSKGLENELRFEYKLCCNSITTIYNPCAVRVLRSMVKYETPHLRSYILVMGRLEKEKNPIAALELYYKGGFYKEYDLIYLGKGSLEETLKKEISNCNLEDYVFLMGFQRHPEQWLMHAALLLSSSREEAFALNIVEALLCNTPVVSVDCPYGPREILIDELSEYLIYPEAEPEKSISVIASALQTYPKITEKYYNRFDDAVIVNQYLKVWKDCFGVEKVAL